jgi:protease-4
MWREGEEIMSGILTKTREDKRVLAVVLTVVFLAGWFSFAYYIYANQVLVIPIEGEIVDFKATTLAVRQAQVDKNVKAVILDLNTPGGYADLCMEIAAYVAELAKVKPVIAIMEDVCASGGYYIASFATYIFPHSNTVTGSIGVIAVWVDMSKYYKNQGINITVWTTASEKDIGADWRGPTKEEYDEISVAVNYMFQKLLTDIQHNRNLSPTALNIIKIGATFSGSDAVQLGLADKVGDIIDAVGETIRMTGMWKFIIVSPDMDERQRFLNALF